MPASSKPDQNSHAYGDRQGGQRAMLDFRGNPVQGIIAYPSAHLDCLVAEARRLMARKAPPTAESIGDFAQNRSDGFANLVPGSGDAARGAPAASSSDSLELVLEGG